MEVTLRLVEKMPIREFATSRGDTMQVLPVKAEGASGQVYFECFGPDVQNADRQLAAAGTVFSVDLRFSYRDYTTADGTRTSTNIGGSRVTALYVPPLPEAF